MTRALVVVRLSVLRDQSTSPERQREHCRNLITARGWTEAGVAEDPGVSATKYSPFQRPELGDWLANRTDEFDTLVCWRLDRLVRSTADLAELLRWCEANGKGLVSATEGFDLGTPFGRAMVTIIAALGQLEAETTRLRVADSHAKLRTTDRWASGVPPLGFRPVPHPSGRGVALETDPGGRELLHTMADKLLSGWSWTALTAWCTETGQLSSQDRARVRAGKEPFQRPWSVSSVRRVLTHPATQGWKATKAGTVALDADGTPIRLAPPTFDDLTWERIQSAAAERSASGRRRRHTANPMVGVGRCGRCQATLAQQFSPGRLRPDGSRPSYRTYRCSRTPVACRGVSHPADDLDSLLEQTFLLAYYDVPVRERVFVPGTDNRAEIEQTRAAISTLSVGIASAQSDTARAALLAQLTAADTRLQELEKTPYRASGWEYRETEETYGDAWVAGDIERRRQLLISAKAGVALHGRNQIAIEVDWAVLSEEKAAERLARIKAVMARLSAITKQISPGAPAAPHRVDVLEP